MRQRPSLGLLLRCVISVMSCRTDTWLPPRSGEPHPSVSEFSVAVFCAEPPKCQHCPVPDKLLIPKPPRDVLRVGTWCVIVRGCSELRYNPAKITWGGDYSGHTRICVCCGWSTL